MPTKNAASKICWPPYAVSLNNVPRGTPAGACSIDNFGARAPVVVRRRCENGVPRAIISSSATIVKSFLRVRAKFFPKGIVFELDPVPTLVVYAQDPGLSRTFCGNCAFILKARRRLYSSASTMSSTFCTIGANKSVDKSLRVWQNKANGGKTLANSRKFWQIGAKNT